jgi:hypothetical protein
MKPHRRSHVCQVALLGFLAATPNISAFTPDQETQLALPFLNTYALFGADVAVSGNTVIVGAANGMVNGSRCGVAHLFNRQDGVWMTGPVLIPGDPRPDGKFGYAVAINADTAVVGAYADSERGSYAGAVYVFTRTGSDWVQQVKLLPNDAAPGLQFGDPVAIDGDRLVVGAFADSTIANYSGAAYVFVRREDTWIQEAKLKAEAPRAYDYFGFSVAIRNDAIVVGAPYQTVGTQSSAGAVHLFERTADTWVRTASLTAHDPTRYALLGWSVAIGPNVLAAGAPLAQGAVPSSGAAYLFGPTDQGWSQESKLVCDDASPSSWFGFSLALSEDTLVVGASQDSTFGDYSGSVYLFTRGDLGWEQTAELASIDVSPGDQFGFSVEFDGASLVVGAPFSSVTALEAGAAYLFDAAAPVPANEAPVADATATVTTAIAAPGGYAQVTLDGSRSQDPDGDPLVFSWYESEALVGQGEQAPVPFSVGHHWVTLKVSDGALETSVNFTISVFSASQVVQTLTGDINGAGLPHGQAKSLLSMLSNADKALARDQVNVAIQQLRVFQNHLRVQSGKHIDPDTADRLWVRAQELIDALIS